MQTCQRGGKPLIVFGQPAEADGPSEGTLNHPSPGQKDKPLLGFFQFDYDQTNAPLGCLLGGFFSGIALIDKSDFDVLPVACCTSSTRSATWARSCSLAAVTFKANR